MLADQRLWKLGEIVDVVDLAHGGPAATPIPQRWYVLRVRPHCEARVMKLFTRLNISAWLPLVTTRQTVTRWRHGFETSRIRNVTSPLFPGVIIIPDFEHDAERWRDVDGVIGVYREGPNTPYLTDQLMTDLRHIEAVANTPKSKRARLFEIGQLVRVVAGPLAGFAARVERFDSKGRLSVGVDIFGRITPIVVSEGDIEPDPQPRLPRRVERKPSFRRIAPRRRPR